MGIMKGLVKYAESPGNVEIRDVEIPTPGAGQVKIEVQYAGICGSDLHIYHSDIAIPVRPPVVMGHEFSGIVTEVGEGVVTCKKGDRVVSETAYSFCGRCPQCTTGFYNLCNERRTLGYWYNGVFTKYTVVPQDRIHILPDSIDSVSAAMIEPLACVTHAVYDMSVIEAGDVVLVSGPGSIGIMTALVAKAQGAVVILTGVDVDENRLLEAKNLGIDFTVNVQKENLTKLVFELTNGNGANAVFECSGNDLATNSCLELCKKRGYFVQIGLGGKPINFNIGTVCYREIKMSGSLGSTKSSWNKAIDLLKYNKIDIRPLATHIMPISEWEEAFKLFENKQGGKLIFTPI